MNAAATLHSAPISKDAADWLIWVTQEMDSAAVLRRLFCKRKDGAEADALLDGISALITQSSSSMRFLRDSGGLLYFGQPVALAAAKAMRQQQGGAA